MQVRVLETFLWVARLKSFRLAAERLFLTQATVSHRIAVLEEELGVRLFVRDSKGVTLTPDGELVREHAERLVSQSHALQQAVGAARQGKGKIRIGVIDSVVYTWLTALVAAISARFPHLELELTSDSARSLSHQLQKGYLDIVFQTDLLRLDAVENLELARYPIGWIVASASPLNRDYGSLAELAQERLITFGAHSRPHQDILSLLHLNGIVAPRVNCVNSFAAMGRLIEDGFGVGAIPPVLVREQLQQGKLTLLQVGDGSHHGPSSLSLVASWRLGSGLEFCQEIVALASQIVQEFALQVGDSFVAPVLHPPLCAVGEK